jgi:hypothetical protein
MVGALDPRARSATITHPGPMGLRRLSPDPIRTSRHQAPPIHDHLPTTAGGDREGTVSPKPDLLGSGFFMANHYGT